MLAAMRFGLALPQYGFSLPTGRIGYDDTVGWARRAEALGFDSVWLSDHFFYSFARYGADPAPIDALEPLTALAAIATGTARVRLGVLVLAAGFRPPELVAKAAAFERFQRLIQTAATADPRTKAAVGLLTPVGEMPWRGAALVIVSPSGDDQVVVTVDGLARGRRPYQVEITDGHGHRVPVAVVRHLDNQGGAMVARIVPRDLTHYVRVVVSDARGRVVLTGVLDRAPPAG